MVWRMSLDRRRSDQRRVAREIALGARRAPNPLCDHIENERAQQLWAAIDALPEKLRVTLVLRSIEGHDVNEVAALLGIPAGTVKSRLFLARKQVKERLPVPASSGTAGTSFNYRTVGTNVDCTVELTLTVIK